MKLAQKTVSGPHKIKSDEKFSLVSVIIVVRSISKNF